MGIVYKYLADKSQFDFIFLNGVYKIYHINRPDYLYIGSTYTIRKYKYESGFMKRFYHHIYHLKKLKHRSKKLQAFVDENGLDGLRFEILEICNSIDESRNKEQIYLDNYKPHFNTSPCAFNNTGAKLSEEACRKLGARMKGKSFPRYVYDSRMKKVFQFNIHGKLVSTYKSTIEAAKKTGIDRGAINNVLIGVCTKSGGFLWSYSDVLLIKKKKIAKKTMDGVLLDTFDTIVEAANSLGIKSGTCISDNIAGRAKHAYGFIWEKIFIDYSE